MSKQNVFVRRNKFDAIPYIAIAPMVITLIVFIFYPLSQNIHNSFMNAKLINPNPRYVGLANYIEIFTRPLVWQAFIRTIKWTVINLFFMSILGISTALLFTANFKGKSIMRAVILIPWVLPPVVTGYIWNFILSQDVGIVLTMLRAIKIVPENFTFFQAAGPAFTAAIIANVWRGYPFFALMLYAKISTISKDQIEAASLDGASGLQLFRYITLPYMRPVYFVCLMLSFMWTFNTYDILKVMTNGGPGGGTTTISLLIAKEAFQNYDLSMASAMSIVTFTVMFIFIMSFRFILTWFNRKEF